MKEIFLTEVLWTIIALVAFVARVIRTLAEDCGIWKPDVFRCSVIRRKYVAQDKSLYFIV